MVLSSNSFSLGLFFIIIKTVKILYHALRLKTIRDVVFLLDYQGMQELCPGLTHLASVAIRINSTRSCA